MRFRNFNLARKLIEPPGSPPNDTLKLAKIQTYVHVLLLKLMSQNFRVVTLNSFGLELRDKAWR